MNTLQKINAIKKPDSFHSMHAYADEESRDIFVDIIAFRTCSENDEKQRFIDLSKTLAEIESIGVNVQQVGNICHEDGLGWVYQIK